jgi:curved DNA-binding protein
MNADFYKELGVERGASEDAIKKAYRKLASQYHPDKNPGDDTAERRFKDINRAYQVLSDKKQRALYDEFGEDGLREGFNPDAARYYKSAGRSPFGGGGGAGFNGGAVNLEDLFGAAGGFVGDLFGGGGGRRRGRSIKGPDVASEVRVDLPTAIRGTTVQVQLQGSAAPVTVRIPPGADNGDRVRVPGHGAPGPGGAGDLLITIHVAPHEHFERDGLDLYLDLPITIEEAYGGAKVPVPTPTGEVTLKVPEGTQSGQVLRLKGRGVKRKDRQGDLYVRFLVKLPKARSAEIEKAVRTLSDATAEDVRADIAF